MYTIISLWHEATFSSVSSVSLPINTWLHCEYRHKGGDKDSKSPPSACAINAINLTAIISFSTLRCLSYRSNFA